MALLPSAVPSTFTSLHSAVRAPSAASTARVSSPLALQLAIMPHEIARVGLLHHAIQRPSSVARVGRRGDDAQHAATLGLHHDAIVGMELHAGGIELVGQPPGLEANGDDQPLAAGPIY